MFHNAQGHRAFYLTFATFVALATASLFMALSTTKARAQTVSTYVGAHAGYAISSTDVSRPAIASSLDGIGSKGFLGGVHAGVDVYLPGSTFFVGAWGAYDWSKVDAKLTTPGGTVTARLGDAWSIGGRIGLGMGKVSPYALLGWKQQESEISLLNVAMPTLKGMVYGLGADYALAQNLKVGAQATVTKFDAQDIATTGLTMKPEALEVTLRLSLALGGPPVATAAQPLK